MTFLAQIVKIIKTVGLVIIFPFNRLYYFLYQIYMKIKLYVTKFSKDPKKKKVTVIKKKNLKTNKLKKLVKSFQETIKKYYDKFFAQFCIVKPFLYGFIIALILIIFPFEVYRWFKLLPSPDTLVVRASQQSTRILDRNGRLLYEIYIDKKYNPVSIKDIPDHVLKAMLAVEDDKFYNHQGVRVDSVIRAARNTLFAGNLQGGSTITQQLVKNVLLTPERTISRKLKEVVLAPLVEMTYSKDEILEMYMNNVPYGGTAWGIQSAAQKYFGKDVWDLNLAEGTLLAGLPSAPTNYSPVSNFEGAKERQRHVLSRMVGLGYISQEQSNEAYESELNIVSQAETIKAPHFVNYVRSLLEKEYGKGYVELGGLTVTTTLDLDLQEKVQGIVKDEVDKNAYLGFSNGAAVVLDSKKAEILAYVGSKDYFQEVWGAFDVVTGFRQPGSSIKPVTYALALSKNYTPATIIEDSKITYAFQGQKPYTPVNYDGKYHGKVTVRQALANSYNVPAVKVTASLGPDNVVQLGKDMGLSNWEVDGSYGLSVTLGGKEVRLLDQTNVFGTFSRQGIYKETTPFLSIKDSQGSELYKDTRKEKQIIDSGISYLLWHILSDNVARTPAFGPYSSLNIPNYKVAVKTGTTDNLKDNWTLGYTPSYTVGVWVGNNDGTPMNNMLASGLTGAAPIWNKIVVTVLEGKSDEVYEMPENVFMKYDEKCKASEVFLKGSAVPATLCIEKEDKDKEDKKKEEESKRND